MTETQWNESDNPISMMEFAFEKQGIGSDSTQHRMGYRMNSGNVKGDSQFETAMHRFYIACCRQIWPLLPDKESRKGVEIAERWLDGNAPDSELNDCDYYVEGAAFGIDYRTSSDQVDQWISDVDAIPDSELNSLLHSQDVDGRDSYQLLKTAAYFAHYSIMYPAINPKGMPPKSYHQFLSPDLLRQYIKYAE